MNKFLVKFTLLSYGKMMMLQEFFDTENDRLSIHDLEEITLVVREKCGDMEALVMFDFIYKLEA